MPQERFDIYFSGELLPDQSPDPVREWLGRQFKLQGQALDHLFSGTPVRIKQNVDMDTAGRYRAAFRQAGALVDIRPVAEQPPAPAATAEDSSAEPELLPPNTGSLEDCAPEVTAAEIPDISYMDLGSPDRPIDETPAAPPADIDTSRLTAEPPNSGDLSDCVQEKPARPIPDISGITLSED